MENTKTGAIICRKETPGRKIVYQAILFITDIPGNFSDADLKAAINLENTIADVDCLELLFRADIHSTSNEVQEQFQKLYTLIKPVPEISFTRLASASGTLSNALQKK